MNREIVINVSPGVTRAALLEDSQTVELFLEYADRCSLLGNIYKGEVRKVLPGINCAFVDIGMERDGFLYIDDVIEEADSWEEMFHPEGSPEKKDLPIHKLLRPGQNLFVQIIRESLPNKGPRVTSQLTLTGKYLVFVPNKTMVGVSKKIDDGEERKRLRALAEEFSEVLEGGVIIRTAARDVPRESMESDVAYVKRLWKSIYEKGTRAPVPSEVYADLSLPLRLMRDLAGEKISRLRVDDSDTYEAMKQFQAEIHDPQPPKILFYDERVPVFEAHGVEKEIDKALRPRVWLKHGGYLVINQTEALVAIDVNSGKFLGKKNLEDTAFKTNMEAIKEIVKQIRLRNLGGILILDIIDMLKASNRKKVKEALEQELRKDRAYSRLLDISSFGLVQMTRKRTRENLVAQLTEDCTYCSGLGRVKNLETVCLEIHNELKKSVTAMNATVLVKAHPEVLQAWKEDWHSGGDEIRKRGVELVLQEEDTFHREQFQIIVS